ncbi:hypothetical protein OQH60_01135 [Campylobacter sp. MIT 21-1685]|uniref:hypothetical protein n=1 Tax=unclassified Campylobacter TaxID=2593542 RepID=UPI00224B10C2|nr:MULTISPECIES: hypothetical protein [unclassified Campylobacter]MCX2682482.1 hypothetical protein [Campylobacter sp. MIT 21-1684]MCX2750805.1 hypothetical protein [Campylobacter sp. MIT 21-1682]MCX2806963.1 hypothetical protein [Campylobacter sp. MIT 21-1685]
MKKDKEKNLRVRYLRKLEKFAYTALCILKKENFDKEEFQKRMQKNAIIFEHSLNLPLHSASTKALENFVKACLDFSKERAELINLANSFHKMKNYSKKEQKYKKYLKDYE